MVYQQFSGGRHDQNKSFPFTNLQTTGLSSIACIVSNSFGTSNATWYCDLSSQRLTAAYPQVVLADLPFDLWRLNEADDGLSDGNLKSFLPMIMGVAITVFIPMSSLARRDIIHWNSRKPRWRLLEPEISLA